MKVALSPYSRQRWHALDPSERAGCRSAVVGAAKDADDVDPADRCMSPGCRSLWQAYDGVGMADEVLRFVASHLQEHGYPPSVREIGAALGLASSATVHHWLHVLERSGRIEVVPGLARAIRLKETA